MTAVSPSPSPRAVSRTPGRDPSSFFGWVSTLVHTHRARLVRLAQREGLRAEEALDAVQEVFYRVLELPRARQLMQSPDGVGHFLAALMRNAARNRRRRHQLAQEHASDETLLADLESPDASAEELISQAEAHIRLRGCVRQLGQLQRRVVTLRMLDEVPGEDLAVQLGISRNHLGVLLHRAKRQLHECMRQAQ